MCSTCITTQTAIRRTNIDHNLGDLPFTGIALDSNTGDLFISTDLGVDTLPSSGSTWVPAGVGLPPVATYGLTIDASAGSSTPPRTAAVPGACNCNRL